ncbi:MAG: serine/threonine protein kinase [Deltaproteobacteria bacterium]|nr:serine/threonine protein kinase [Deltaproteobacteria bacterium]
MSSIPPSGSAKIPEVGEVLDSKYKLTERIGEGGMGVVFQGEHLLLQSTIAIKCLKPELAMEPAALARFLQEARLAASIESEHSTRIHDVGTTPTGVPFIVMEHLRGEALDAHIEREGPMAVQDAVTVVIQTLAVLAEAHGKGLVHRDLKPANLFLQERSDGATWVKVMDFGISKAVSRDTMPKAGITAPHVLLGSPEYMAPEQLRDPSAVDRRCDIWSIGVVLYELLAATTPFQAPSLAELCAKILDQEPASLRRTRGDVPPGLEALIAKTLSKHPSDRPQTVGELALLLAPYAPESVRASVGRINAVCLKASRATPRPLHVPVGAGRDRGRWVTMAMGLALVAITAVFAWVLASRTDRSRETMGPPQTMPPATIASVLLPQPAPQPTEAPAPAPTAPAALPAATAMAPATDTNVARTSAAGAKVRVGAPPAASSGPSRIRRPSQITIVD